MYLLLKQSSFDRKSAYKNLLCMAFLSFLFASCSNYPDPHSYALGDQSFKLTVDHGGNIKNYGDSEPTPFKRLRQELALLGDHLRAGKYTHIAVIVHGGLVGPATATEESDLIARKIASENKALDHSGKKGRKIFPIFINWDTSPINSYGRHLVSDEAGITSTAVGLGSFSSKNGYMMPMMPLKIVGDLGAGITRAPAHLLRSVIRFNGKNIEAGKNFPEIYPAQAQVYRDLNYSFPTEKPRLREPIAAPYSKERPEFPFNFQLGHSEVPDVSERMVTGFIFMPVKIATSPLADSIGTPAWDNMKRRAKLLSFHPQQNTGTLVPGDRSRGAGNVLLTSLAEICRKNSQLSLELYGHSMGTIVLNEMIASTQVSGFGPTPKIDKIVYMAAACKISDFMVTAGEYIRTNQTSFHNLTLHPVQEVRESLWNDIGSPLMSGSLLTWIDEMFERPPSFQERTLGTFNNTVVARDLLPKGKNIHIKAFPAAFRKGSLFNRDKNSRLGPQSHGAFNNYRFWHPKFHEANSDQTEFTPLPEN